MKVICCVCHKTKDHNGWTYQPDRPGIPLSHGYCPKCYQQMMQKFERFFGIGNYAQECLKYAVSFTPDLARH